jgi:hypothetical protein
VSVDQTPKSGAAVIPGHSHVVNTKLPASNYTFNVGLLAIGSIFHLLAEASLLPLVAAGIYYCVGRVFLLLRRIGGWWERRIYNQVFLTGFLVSSIASLYRTFAGDSQGDASYFYENASRAVDGWTIAEIAAITEGAVAVVLWREIYNVMALVGFPRSQYVGILVNTLVIALSSVISMKMAKLVYGFDVYRFKMLILLFSACGLIWIFAGIFLRDSVVLFGVSLLAYAWVYYLCKPDIGYRLCVVVAASVLASAAFALLRSEFTFVPIAMALAAIAALLVGVNTGRNRSIAYLIVVVGIIVVGWITANFGEVIGLVLLRGVEGYAEQAATQHGADSLGMLLIVNQPILIRAPLGALYLFFFPIPFWTGFQLESAYALFKSLNVIYFYFVVPLLVLTVRHLYKIKLSRTPPVLFLLFAVFGFTLAIAGTSLETRHLGVFFGPMFMLALYPDMRLISVKHRYKKILIAVLSSVFIVHYLWAVVKLGFIFVGVSLAVALLVGGLAAISNRTRYN